MDEWELFKGWVKVHDGSFRVPARNAVPFINNFLACLQTKNLSNIGLIFLPPHTTSVLQSMKEMVIKKLQSSLLNLNCEVVHQNHMLRQIRNLEADECPSKENLFGQSALLINAT